MIYLKTVQLPLQINNFQLNKITHQEIEKIQRIYKN